MESWTGSLAFGSTLVDMNVGEKEEATVRAIIFGVFFFIFFMLFGFSLG